MISLTRYATLLERPELRRTIVASVIGRLPIGILGLAILLATQAASGSFGHAGAVAACYLAGLATMAPVLGRVIDRKDILRRVTNNRREKPASGAVAG